MSLLQKLFAPSSERNVLWLYVRCDQCDAKVRVRIDLYNDLSWTDDGGYILRKEIMDSQCYRLMNAVLRFDNARCVTSCEISGGEFITKDEYESGMR